MMGVSGVSNDTLHGHDRYIAETIRLVISTLVGRHPFGREVIWYSLWFRVSLVAGGIDDGRHRAVGSVGTR